jgi:hypothetical protein
MVDEIDHDSLAGGSAPRAGAIEAEEDKPALPRECKGCGCLVPALVRECPACGLVSARPTGVENVAGDLAEFKRGKRSKPEPVAAQLMAMGKPSIWGQLLSLQKQYSWSDGRTAHAFRELFGVWPNHYRDEPSREPTMELRSWVRSRSIAYAKSKGARDAA